MTDQELQEFPDMSQVLLHRINKINLCMLIRCGEKAAHTLSVLFKYVGKDQHLEIIISHSCESD
jgi:hypothetical protein